MDTNRRLSIKMSEESSEESPPIFAKVKRREADSDSIVISGISGRYPESLNLDEFWDQLINGKELSSIDDRRWPVGESECRTAFRTFNKVKINFLSCWENEAKGSSFI